MNKPPFFLTPAAYFTPAGRISRLQYFVFGLIWLAIFVAMLSATLFSGMVPLDDQGNPVTYVGMALYSVPQMFVVYIVTCLAAKRAHDLGWTGWLALIMVFDIPVDLALQAAHLAGTVPEAADQVGKAVDGIAKIAQMGLGIGLTFVKGNIGANSFGPDPLRAPTPVEVF